MKPSELKRALAVAVVAARAAGALMRRNARVPKRINLATQHDIKLELDVRCQRLIERQLRAAFPASSVFGEEECAGDPAATLRWVVDPIDGTVNFTYGIPHACVSIALQERTRPSRRDQPGEAGFRTVLGVVYDPFCEELWTAAGEGPARLNGRRVRVAMRHRLEEAVVSLGFGKQTAVLQHLLPAFSTLADRVRKLRIMGSAALALTYVASGRFDAFVELGLGWWDIAAGGFIVERAGGEFWRRELAEGHYEVIVTNRRLRRALTPHLPVSSRTDPTPK
jgi:myo-inositol-1(or 4)-monophosphatase